MNHPLPPDHEEFDTSANTEALLTAPYEKNAVPTGWWNLTRTDATSPISRLRALRGLLHSEFVGLDDVIDWLLASIVARENTLLLGPPGVAKSALVTRLYQLLGLRSPPPPDQDRLRVLTEGDPWTNWQSRTTYERETRKYFHYLLSRFTQPEELFGPVEIEMLRKGVLVRVGFGLLTGPGVRAAFLDEIFKASSSILNTLLTIFNERKFFNWGGMEPSDLLFLIGASNELPGGSYDGAIVAAQDDFAQLYAFLDRFALRLLVPPQKATEGEAVEKTPLGLAFQKAAARESIRFSTGRGFSTRPSDMPSINDIICLGRCILEATILGQHIPFDGISQFHTQFLKLGASLEEQNTDLSTSWFKWTINTRKLVALYKIALAHAMICASHDAPAIVLGSEQLRVFEHIGDSADLVTREELKNLVATASLPYTQ